jgi:hypothetical protein
MYSGRNTVRLSQIIKHLQYRKEEPTILITVTGSSKFPNQFLFKTDYQISSHDRPLNTILTPEIQNAIFSMLSSSIRDTLALEYRVRLVT